MTTTFTCEALPATPAPATTTARALAIATFALMAAVAALLAAGALAGSPPVQPQGPFSVGIGEGGGAATGVVGWILGTQSGFYASLTEAMGGVAEGRGGLVALLGLAFLYGVFHAAGPGHGKAVIATWMFANERSLGRGLRIAAGAALVQAMVAVCLVGALGGILRMTAQGITGTTAWVESASFLGVAALGAALLARKSLALAAPQGRAHDAGCACHAPPSTSAPGSRGALAAVAAAGARPCSGAIVVLALALSTHAFAQGVAATLAMAAGTALTTGALACVAVKAKAVALALAGGTSVRGRGALLVAEVAASAMVCALGLCLLAASLQGRVA